MFVQLEEKQLTQLLATLRDSPKTQNAYDAAVLAVSTGARPCEIAALRFSDVNWDSITVKIRSRNKDAHRILPITPALKNVLAKRQGAAQGGDLVFGKKARETVSALGRVISGVAKSLGFERISFRTLRHSFAFALVGNGVPINVLFIALGSKSPLAANSKPTKERVAEILRESAENGSATSTQEDDQ